ncbi:hypothetical protein KL86DPRO_11516 [uncultured delta proteobacterium]|uniref:Uncharacterized protein n=1 Tax=uncultured delta proteobacterium TaxID=34034 RepID=A0A212JI58_9DELT|nr:hypothetical protein KL86DPRO_11516 [uncultured delta proteobacterium]
MPFYALNLETGALRLPDLRGMYAEAAGFDGLDVGGVHGDTVRNVTGGFTSGGPQHVGTLSMPLGAFTLTNEDFPVNYAAGVGMARTDFYVYAKMDLSRVVPVGNANKPRAFGVLPCVYLGKPAS